MVIYITTCDKSLNQAEYIQDLMKKSPYPFFFVYGKNQTKMLDPHIVVDVTEAYENLPEKTYCLVEHFINNFPDNKLVKMDDDCWIDFEKLKRYENAPEDYIGFFHAYELGEFGKFFHWYKIQNPEYKVLKKHFRLAYCEGAMYLLSRKACEKILMDGRLFYRNTPETYLGEDVHVGMSLQGDDITKRDIKMKSDLFFEITEDFMSVHPVSLLTFKKMTELTTNRQKMDFLTKFNFLSDNARRIKFLREVKPMVEANQSSSVGAVKSGIVDDLGSSH